MISLIVCTYRPGGLDLLVECLSKTLPGKEPWELIVIDDHPGRVQRGEANAFLRQHLPVGYYGHSKPKSYPDAKGGLCNAINTALFHARGEFTVWLSDYTLLPPHWLLHWENLRERFPGKLISGVAIEYFAPKPTGLTDVQTWEGSNLPTLTPKKPWVPWEFETFYYGAPIELFETLNGVDERADHCHCWPVSSMISHAKQLKREMLVDQELVCHMIDHRSWDFFAEIPAPDGCGGEGLWRITDLQSIPEEPEWSIPCPNPFDLVAIREFHGVRQR